MEAPCTNIQLHVSCLVIFHRIRFVMDEWDTCRRKNCYWIPECRGAVVSRWCMRWGEAYISWRKITPLSQDTPLSNVLILSLPYSRSCCLFLLPKWRSTLSCRSHFLYTSTMLFPDTSHSFFSGWLLIAISTFLFVELRFIGFVLRYDANTKFACLEKNDPAWVSFFFSHLAV